MALTVVIEGKGVIANCDQLTDDTGGTGTGDWSEEGTGTMSLSTDSFKYSSSSIGGKYASKVGLQQFDLGVGNELDFDTAGAEEGQLIYIWIMVSALGTLDVIANDPLGIQISSSTPGTTNYKRYVIAGNDDQNGWDGGWRCFVIDPTKTGTVESGSCDIGAIRTIGLWIDTTASARADAFFIDQIAVGSGLRITGTSTYGWQEIVDYCTDYSNRAWGMVQEREGIFYVYGKINIGDASSQSADVDFSDAGRVIQFGISEYYDNSGNWVTSIGANAFGINIEDHTSYKTEFTDGILVGTDKGRSGSLIIGVDDQNVSADLHGGNHADSATLCYGTTFSDLTGALNSGNDTGHKFFSCSFIRCNQFDPVGAPVIRNCTFAESWGPDSALLWNENINIQYCNFIANEGSSGETRAGIEHPSNAGDPYGHIGLQFSGNTDDVLNSSGVDITINNSGNPASNGSSSSGAGVTFLTAIDLIITVQDKDTNAIVGARVGVYKTSDRTELMNEETIAGGIAQQSYNGGATNIEVRVRDVTGTPKYKPFSTLGVTGGSDYELLVTLEEDPNA